MRTMYAVKKETFEFNPRKYPSIEDAWNAYNDHDDVCIGIFETLEEAREVLAKVEVETVRFSYSLARGDIAYIEEATFDNEDGEWEFVAGSDFWDFKFEELPNDDDEDEDDDD